MALEVSASQKGIDPSLSMADRTPETDPADKDKADRGPALPPVSYWKLYSTADVKDKILIVIGLIGSCGGGVMLPLFSVVFGEFVNAFGDPDTGGLMDTTRTLALKFVWLAIAGFVSMYMEVTAFVLAGERQTNRLRSLYLSAVLRQDIAFFDTSATAGGLLQGLNEDSLAVQAAISEKAGNFVHHMSTFVTGFIIAFTYGWDMTLVMLGVLPLLAIMGSLIGWVATSKAKADSEAYTEASTIAQQAISSVRTVMAYNGQDAAINAYAGALDKPVKAGIRNGFLSALGLGGLQWTMYISYAVGLVYGAFRIIAGKYTGGDVVLVNIATLMASFALGQAAPSLGAFGTGRAAGAKMFHIIERVPGIKDVGDGDKGVAGAGAGAGAGGRSSADSTSTPSTSDIAVRVAANGETDVAGKEVSKVAVEMAPYHGTGELDKVVGRLNFVDVSFAYPARPDILVFKNFNLEVPSGQTVALVGASGSGKSTAIQLIERFYDPLSGSVLLDGVDLRSLKMSFLRKHVGLVSQEPTLFATTIYENIALGKEGATQEEVLQAAVAANAHKFIHILPDGYYTQVGERGVQLSGGQKQRIAIARAILKNPKVLLLDEATSALDTQSERIVQAALDRMVVGRTTVVVAHRLSTIKHAHKIAVVANGGIGEAGTHDELLAKPDGMYRLLVQMQMQAAEQDKGQEVVEEAGVEEAEDDEDGEAVQPVDLSEAGIAQALAGARTSSGPVAASSTAAAAIASAQAHPGSRLSLSNSGALPPTSSSGAPLQPAGGSQGAQARPGSRLSLQGAGSGAAQGPGSGLGGKRGSLEQAADVRRTSITRVSAEAGLKQVVVLEDKPAEKKQLSEKEREKLDELRAKDVPMSRLFSLNKPEWIYIFLGCLGSVGAGLQHPALAFVFSDMVKIFFLSDMDELKNKAVFYCLMFLVIAFGALISVVVQQFCLGYAGAKLAQRIRVLLMRAILRQEVAFFDQDENSSGRLTSFLATDATYVRGAVADGAAVALQNLSTLAIGYLIAFAYNWQMALVVTGTFPILIGSMVLQMQFAMGASSTSDSLYAKANQYINEAFSSIRVIQAYNLQSYITNKYGSMLAATRPTLTKQAHLGGLGMGFSFSMMFALYALIVWFGGWQLAHDQTDFEGFLKGFMSILLAAMGMAQAGIAFPDLGKAKGAVGRIFPVLDRVPAIDVDNEAAEKPSADQIQGEVAFQKVKFVYPNRPSVIIYNDFSLTIPAGKVYALVGESGSGKSTVVSLLERFYDPVEGAVLLDGRDIRQYNLKWLRKYVGLVSQEPILFAGTVADNIKYGLDREVTSEELEAAARVANAAEFINRLPEGYSTRVGEGGIQLSGGQKQRIAIARAVMKNPKVLLLDEATSALDARSERVVQDALDVVMTGRTCLVIAHRLSTIKNANAISVLYRGAVIEQGTHAELMAIPDGAYAKLVAAQERAHGQ